MEALDLLVDTSRFELGKNTKELFKCLECLTPYVEWQQLFWHSCAKVSVGEKWTLHSEEAMVGVKLYTVSSVTGGLM